jgi:RNA polymerase sigma-70 factor (ECF subfamily)
VSAVYSDQELLAAISKGCTSSFAALYEKYKERIYRFALSRLQDSELASDCLQETFLTVWKSAASFTGKSTVSTWVFGVAHNKIRETRRKHRPTEELISEMQHPGVGNTSESSENRLVVLSAVRALPEEQQEVVLLAYYAGLTYREIAELQRVAVGTVKSRMFLARRALLTSLGEVRT